jgi:hypothetical protein
MIDAWSHPIEVPAARKIYKPKSTTERMCNKTYLRTATESLVKR